VWFVIYSEHRFQGIWGLFWCRGVLLLSVMGLIGKVDGETEAKGGTVPCPR